MKYIKTQVLSSSKEPNEKKLFRVDIKSEISKTLQNKEVISTHEITTISSTISLKPGDQFLRIKNEYVINGKTYLVVDETYQSLTIGSKN